MKRVIPVCLVVVLFFLCKNGVTAGLDQLAPVPEKERCAVCGMFVAKYPAWVTQARSESGGVAMFDGPKDFFVYYFNLSSGGKEHKVVTDLRVKDYYTQQWLDGFSAWYVVGSDVLGPMGKEFVPFATREAAENFVKDHHGKKVLRFEEVTPELVKSMRKGHKMMKKG